MNVVLLKLLSISNQNSNSSKMVYVFPQFLHGYNGNRMLIMMDMVHFEISQITWPYMHLKGLYSDIIVKIAY